jgi:hypothetical protein
MSSDFSDQIEISSERPFTWYFSSVLLGVAVLLVAGSVLIWSVDPFKRLLTANDDKAFCDSQAAGGQSAWFMKSIVFASEPHDAIIVGSSKYHYIDPALFKYFEFVNGSVGAATPEYMYELLRAYANDVRVVVLALDFYMFNEARFPYATDRQIEELRTHYSAPRTPAARQGWFSQIFNAPSYLLSGQALLKVGHALTMSRSKRWTMPRGNWNIADWEAEMRQQEAAGSLRINRPAYDAQLSVLRDRHYTPYVFSDRRVEALKKIRDLMAGRHIKLIVQLNPVNVEDRNLIESLPARKDFVRYRRAVREVFPNVSDFTGPEYSDRKLYFTWDPIHFRPALAAKLVNQQLEAHFTSQELVSAASRGVHRHAVSSNCAE